MKGGGVIAEPAVGDGVTGGILTARGGKRGAGSWCTDTSVEVCIGRYCDAGTTGVSGTASVPEKSIFSHSSW